LQGDQHRRPEEGPHQGPGTAQDGDEDEFHGHVEGHDHGRIDAEIVLHEEGAAQGGQGRRKGHGGQFHDSAVHPQGFGGFLAFPHRPQVIAEAMAFQPAHQPEGDQEQGEGTVVVTSFGIMPHEVPQAFFD